ncbi:MAG: hypothetical protein ACE5JX_09360 [Acidobacteriota bacterium]
MKKEHVLCLAVLLLVLVPVLRAQDSERSEEILPLILTPAEDPPRAYTTTLYIMNLANTTVEITVEAFADGEPAAVLDADPEPVARTTIRLESGESVRHLLIPRPLGSDPNPLRRAWLRLTSPDPGSFAASARVTHFLLGNREEVEADSERATDFLELDRRIISDVQFDSVHPSGDFKSFLSWDGFEGCFPGAMSAYSVINPNSETATLRIRFVEFVSPHNRLIHVTSFRLPAGTRINRLLSEVFPELFPPPEGRNACSDHFIHQSGVLDLSSDLPVAMVAINLNLATQHFVDLPVRVVAEAIPDDN